MNATTEVVSAQSREAFDFRPVVCGVCGSSDANVLGWRGGNAHHQGSGFRTRIVRCRKCSHIYPNPMPFPVCGLDQLYTNTEEYFHGHELEAKKQTALERMSFFEGKLGYRGSYLDIACGRGESLWAAKECGWNYDGIDASSEYLTWAAENLGVRGKLGTLDEIKFPANHFDAITMNAIIEHLYDPFGTMCEVFRILKPGGLLWFDAPNESGLYMLVGNMYMRSLGRDWCVNLAPTFPPYHVQGFTPKSLRTLLARVGFEILNYRIEGGMWSFTGPITFRKRLEFNAARVVAWLGRKTGRGSYMEALVRKPTCQSSEGSANSHD